MLVIFLPFVLMSLAGGHRGSGPLDALASLGLLSLLVSLIVAAVPVGRRRALHDLCAGSRVVRATKRKIEWKQDARLMMPGRVDLTKQA